MFFAGDEVVAVPEFAEVAVVAGPREDRGGDVDWKAYFRSALGFAEARESQNVMRCHHRVEAMTCGSMLPTV